MSFCKEKRHIKTEVLSIRTKLESESSHFVYCYVYNSHSFVLFFSPLVLSLMLFFQLLALNVVLTSLVAGFNIAVSISLVDSQLGQYKIGTYLGRCVDHHHFLRSVVFSGRKDFKNHPRESIVRPNGM